MVDAIKSATKPLIKMKPTTMYRPKGMHTMDNLTKRLLANNRTYHVKPMLKKPITDHDHDDDFDTHKLISVDAIKSATKPLIKMKPTTMYRPKGVQTMDNLTKRPLANNRTYHVKPMLNYDDDFDTHTLMTQGAYNLKFA